MRTGYRAAKFTFINSLLILISIGCVAQAQSFKEVKFPEPKRFIDKIEGFVGPSLYIPNDHGWAEFTFSESNGRTIYKASSEMGFHTGINFVHSINNTFEVHGKFSIDKRRYSENRVYLDINGNVTSESQIDQKNDYVVVSLAPAYFLPEFNRLHFFAGVSYAFLTRSLAFDALSGGTRINTIDGFEKHVVDALAGIGYFFPIREKFSGAIRLQGNYGLSYTLNQNKQSISINGVSLTLAIRYSR